MAEQRIGILIEAVNTSGEQFREVEKQLTELEQARRNASKYAYTERRAVMYLASAYRFKYRAVYDTIGVLRSVGAIGGRLLSMWNAQNIAQIRLSQSIGDVADAQEYMNEMLYLFGDESAQYEDALDRVTDAEERVEAAQRSVEMGNALMVLNLVGTVGSIGSFALKIGELAGKYQSVSTAVNAAKAAIAAFSISAAAGSIAAGAIIAGGLSAIEETILAQDPDAPSAGGGLGFVDPDMAPTIGEVAESGADAYTGAYGDWRLDNIDEFMGSQYPDIPGGVGGGSVPSIWDEQEFLATRTYKDPAGSYVGTPSGDISRGNIILNIGTIENQADELRLVDEIERRLRGREWDDL